MSFSSSISSTQEITAAPRSHSIRPDEHFSQILAGISSPTLSPRTRHDSPTSLRAPIERGIRVGRGSDQTRITSEELDSLRLQGPLVEPGTPRLSVRSINTASSQSDTPPDTPNTPTAPDSPLLFQIDDVPGTPTLTPAKRE